MFEKFKKMTAAAVIGAMVMSSAVPMPAIAQDGPHDTDGPDASERYDGQYGGRDRYIGQYCNQHGWNRDCRDWRDNRRGWRDSQYQNWYRRHHGGSSDAAIAAGIFGFAIGAMAGAAANSNSGGLSNAHVERCQARYRSYDVATDSYMGYDGRRHRCNL